MDELARRCWLGDLFCSVLVSCVVEEVIAMPVDMHSGIIPPMKRETARALSIAFGVGVGLSFTLNAIHHNTPAEIGLHFAQSFIAGFLGVFFLDRWRSLGRPNSQPDLGRPAK